MTILLVEDDAMLAITTGNYALAILDVTPPDGSGFDLLKTLRRNGEPLPVIMPTAHTGLPTA